jgi:hypothetical protein
LTARRPGRAHDAAREDALSSRGILTGRIEEGVLDVPRVRRLAGVRQFASIGVANVPRTRVDGRETIGADSGVPRGRGSSSAPTRKKGSYDDVP